MPYIPPEVVAKAKEILTGAAAMLQSSRIWSGCVTGRGSLEESIEMGIDAASS